MAVTQTPTAQWSWTNLTSAGTPTVSAFYNGLSTKSGVMPADVQAFIGIPLTMGGPNGIPYTNAQIIQFIRWAEDIIETDTGVLLSYGWVASPPELQSQQAVVAGLPNKTQMLGVDYDVSDVGYDFFYQRWIEEGWGYLVTRYKPLRIVGPSGANFTSVKNDAFIYPLLNEFFTIPPSWMVEDGDSGLIRIVPATNIAMLPLFAIQIALMGYGQNLPGAIHLQYTAGLTPSDYSAKWSFISQYVLAQTAIQILTAMQTSINYGATDLMVLIDSLKQETKYSPEGPYIGFINRFKEMRDQLYARVSNLVTGPYIGEL